MAANNYQLQQQKASLAARIKTLINNDLKEICKAYGYQVSGNKSALQMRCLEILEDAVDTNDRVRFDELNQRVNNHGLLRHSTGYSTPTYVKTPDNRSSYHAPPSPAPYTSSHNRPPAGLPRSGANRLPPDNKLFKTSPFYEILETALPFAALPEYPNNRNTVNAILELKDDMVQRLRADSTLRLLLYCGIDQGLYQHSPPIDVAFPYQLEVKINGDDVRSNFKGLKNKPGSTKPADITDKVRKAAGYRNQLSIVYALTTKRYIFGVLLARYVSATALTERIKMGKFIPKQTVLDEMNRANADPDIAATSVRMSLKDPISTMRITVPVRSDRCPHNQCFDGSMFMQLQEQAPQWTCPVCSRPVIFESLRVDKYFEEILHNTQKSIEKVEIEPNGEWHVIKEEEDNSQSKSNPQRGPRAAYDDDFDDDDVVELLDDDDDVPAATNGHANGSFNRSTSYLSSSKQMNTPPLSSRETSVAQQQQPNSAHSQGTKRPTSSRPSANTAPTVIDLISSDEDDEPPRPAKRQFTSMPLRKPTPTSTTTSAPNHTAPSASASAAAATPSSISRLFLPPMSSSSPSTALRISPGPPPPTPSSAAVTNTTATSRPVPADQYRSSNNHHHHSGRPPWPDSRDRPSGTTPQQHHHHHQRNSPASTQPPFGRFTAGANGFARIGSAGPPPGSGSGSQSPPAPTSASSTSASGPSAFGYITGLNRSAAGGFGGDHHRRGEGSSTASVSPVMPDASHIQQQQQQKQQHGWRPDSSLSASRPLSSASGPHGHHRHYSGRDEPPRNLQQQQQQHHHQSSRYSPQDYPHQQQQQQQQQQRHRSASGSPFAAHPPSSSHQHSHSHSNHPPSGSSPLHLPPFHHQQQAQPPQQQQPQNPKQEHRPSAQPPQYAAAARSDERSASRAPPPPPLHWPSSSASGQEAWDREDAARQDAWREEWEGR